MASRSKVKTAFKKARTIAPLYTGGPVAVTPDGQRLVTCVGEEALLTDLNQGIEICRFHGDTESITSLCITPSGKQVLIFTSSMSLRIFDLPPASSPPLTAPLHPTRVIARAHDAPVHVCKADPTSTYLASGAADGTVKVWDIARGFPTHVLRGHGGVVSALAWSFPVLGLGIDLGERTMRLVTGSVDTRVRVWDLARCAEEAKAGKAARPEAVLEGHVSVPRGLDVSADGRWLVSGGRDAVVLVWDMKAKGEKKAKGKGKGKEKEGPVLVKTVTALERVEAVGLLAEEEQVAGSSEGSEKLRFYTAGEKGVVRVWNGKEGSVVWTFGEEHQEATSEDQEEQRQILDAIYIPSTSTIVSIHADQNLLFHSLPTGTLSRQLIGFNDEIIDATFLRSPSAPSSSETHLALATNSSLIRLYSTQTLDARLLSGHSDIVLCLAASASGTVLASGAKDRSARLWAPTNGPSTSTHQDWSCIATCEGHAGSIGALAFARQTGVAGGLKFLFTGSQDRTIKMWDLASLDASAADGAPARCRSLCTHKAHDKDINALDVAPTDALLASGSQDRTAKVYAIAYAAGVRGELTLLGTCRGHKRGVWSVRFARHERVLATGGGDRTVRVWGLDRFECLRVLEGHGNSVLRVDWLVGAAGRRAGGGDGEVVSAGADGLVKVWDVKSEECVATLDGHEDKVWALAVSADGKRVVSGAADSVVTFWEDCTEEEVKKREEVRAEMVLKEQDFLNYVALHDYQRAIELALSLEHPGRLYGLFKDLASSAATDPAAQQPSITGHPAVDTVLRTLHSTDLARLLGYIRTWNARAKTSAVAQRVLHALVRLRPAEDIPADVLEGLIPYTERHLARVERLVRESYVVDFVLGEMDMHAAFHEDEMEVDVEESRVVVVGA